MEDVLSKWSRLPFQYGTSDCCQFVGAVIEEMTGTNPALEFRYGTEAEAYRIIGQYGDLDDLVTSVFGEPIDPADSLPGDLLSIDLGDRTMLAVNIGGLAVYKTPSGITDWGIEAATKAWSVEPCRQ